MARRIIASAAGGAPASIAAVAARAGVSIATVSRVANGVANKASAETVARVRAAIVELGWRPMQAGRDLRQGSSRLVALLAANIANPTMAAIAAASEAALRAAGLGMVLCDSHEDPALQEAHLADMRALRARVTVLLGAVASPSLVSPAAPLLFVNRRCPGVPGAPFVGIDNRAAGALVAAELVRRGRRRLAAIHGPLASSATAERLAGFSAQARRLRVAMAVATAEGVDHLRIGHQGMERLLADVPDGVFCTSDLIAYGAHRRALEAGLAVPHELALVGFDDSPLNDWVAPWLASVAVPHERFGAAIAAAVAALEAGAGSVETILPHRFVARGL